MENKMYNQPPYNTQYGPSQTEQANYSAFPVPPPTYTETYPPQSGHPSGNFAPAGYYGGPQPYAPSPAGPTGYYGAPQPAPAVIVVQTTTSQIPPTQDENIEAVTNFGSSFSDKNIRRVFVRKVYAILLVQLVFTFGIVALFTFQDQVKQFVKSTPGVYWASYAVFLVTYITLACCPTVRRRYPANIICLIIFTIALAYMTGTIASTYDTKVVFMAAGLCAGVCLGITLLSMWSKFDVTGCGMFLAVASMVVMWFGFFSIWFYSDVLELVYCSIFALLMMMFDVTGYGMYLAVACWVLFFFGLFSIFSHRNIMYNIYCALAVLLLMCLLAYNTQLIVGGRRYEISPEEHIHAALSLYMNIVLIFLFMMGLMGRGN